MQPQLKRCPSGFKQNSMLHNFLRNWSIVFADLKNPGRNYWSNCFFFFFSKLFRCDALLITFLLQNVTLYHLSVLAAPTFVIPPKDVFYVSIGDIIILPCQVYQQLLFSPLHIISGRRKTRSWNPLVQTWCPSHTVWFCQGNIRILFSIKTCNNPSLGCIRHSDLSDSTWVAWNGEERIHHTVKDVIAGICSMTNYCSNNIYNNNKNLFLASL